MHIDARRNPTRWIPTRIDVASPAPCTVLVKKIDGLRVGFHSVAAAEPHQDLFDPLTWSMLFPHPSSSSPRDSAATEFAFLRRTVGSTAV
ncbi:hypothetical protein Y032_0397g691 [Ancylostoma ceylanicum]|uniref:Uncharacterized protein n=1 Tax=Ancylostoma ceylanicum TaxID=53326 RepID=A0A016RRF8_9BILA|nr:hypothetical protein Y032_0397g691 [Ancylostoma ceylanicum]